MTYWLSHRFLVCPQCGRKGVSLRLGAEDLWGCRYCDWYAYADGNDDADVRERTRLIQANPGREDDLPLAVNP